MLRVLIHPELADAVRRVCGCGSGCSRGSGSGEEPPMGDGTASGVGVGQESGGRVGGEWSIMWESRGALERRPSGCRGGCGIADFEGMQQPPRRPPISRLSRDSFGDGPGDSGLMDFEDFR
jgi:hypothetical protein